MSREWCYHPPRWRHFRFSSNVSEHRHVTYQIKVKVKVKANNDTVHFCGVDVRLVDSGKHLGRTISSTDRCVAVDNAVRDIYIRFNLLLSKFHFCSPEVRYHLFKVCLFNCLWMSTLELWWQFGRPLLCGLEKMRQKALGNPSHDAFQSTSTGHLFRWSDRGSVAEKTVEVCSQRGEFNE